MTFKGQIPILYINLDRRPDRREQMQAQFEALGLHAQRLAATDGAGMTPEQVAARSPTGHSSAYGRPLSNAEIACYDSHVRAHEVILRNGWPWACILEDDVKIDPAFVEWVRAPGPIATLSEHCDILKFEAWEGGTGKSGFAVARIADRDVMVFLAISLGSAGYFISRRGAERMLSASAIAEVPFDHALALSRLHGVEVWELSPGLASQNESDTDIQGAFASGWVGRGKDWRRARRRAATAGYRIIRRECGAVAAFRVWAGRKLRKWRKDRV